MTGLMQYIKQVAKEDVRLFVVPLAGAIEAIKTELRRPQGGTLKEIAINDIRLFFAPFIGAADAVKEEMKKGSVRSH